MNDRPITPSRIIPAGETIPGLPEDAPGPGDLPPWRTAAPPPAPDTHPGTEPGPDTDADSTEDTAPDSGADEPDTGAPAPPKGRRVRRAKRRARLRKDGEPDTRPDSEDSGADTEPDTVPDVEDAARDTRAPVPRPALAAIDFTQLRHSLQRTVLLNAPAAAVGAWGYGAFTARWDTGIPQTVLGWMHDAASTSTTPATPLVIGGVTTIGAAVLGSVAYGRLAPLVAHVRAACAVLHWLLVRVPVASCAAAVLLYTTA